MHQIGRATLNVVGCIYDWEPPAAPPRDLRPLAQGTLQSWAKTSPRESSSACWRRATEGVGVC